MISRAWGPSGSVAWEGDTHEVRSGRCRGLHLDLLYFFVSG